MLYRGGRETVPSSRYGSVLMVLEAMHWTLEEYLAQPDDMITELTIRISKRLQAEAKAAKQSKAAKHGSGK